MTENELDENELDENELDENEFVGKIRLRKVGGNVAIPKEIRERLDIVSGDVIEVKIVGKNHKAIILTTRLQEPNNIYLRKMDIELLGIVYYEENKNDEMIDEKINIDNIMVNISVKKV